jgi:hypothetical protein
VTIARSSAYAACGPVTSPCEAMNRSALIVHATRCERVHAADLQQVGPGHITDSGSSPPMRAISTGLVMGATSRIGC